MQTSYIYSVSRVNALSQALLNSADIERLLVAEAGEDLQSALKETYLAPYLVHVPGENVSLAVEQTIIEAKNLVHKLAPQGDMFQILWLQYDIHNLRVFAKAVAKGLDFSACQSYVSERGNYEPAYLFNQITNDDLHHLNAEWSIVFKKAVDAINEGDIQMSENLFDQLYFATAKSMLAKVNDSFMNSYLVNFIDLTNLKNRLRFLTNDALENPAEFIAGGSISADMVENLDMTLAAFARLGGETMWQEAIKFYQETKNSTKIDVVAKEYLLSLAKTASADMFSSASLVLYYLRCRQAASNIRAIVAGKNTGMKAEDIRSNLSLAYVNN